jgi:hypothetical protein
MIRNPAIGSLAPSMAMRTALTALSVMLITVQSFVSVCLHHFSNFDANRNFLRKPDFFHRGSYQRAGLSGMRHVGFRHYPTPCLQHLLMKRGWSRAP